VKQLTRINPGLHPREAPAVSISFYQLPPLPHDEAARETAVEASGMLAARTDPVLGPALSDVACQLRRRLGADASLISAVHRDTQHVLAADGLPLGPYSRRLSFCGHAVATRDELFCVPDLAADDRFAGNPWVNGENGGFRFYAAAQIRDADGQPLGVVCVVDGRPRLGLAPAEADVLRATARRVEAQLDMRDAARRSPAADDVPDTAPPA